jgi:hypothetical protein
MGYNPWMYQDNGPPDRTAVVLLFVFAIVFPPISIALGHIILTIDNPVHRPMRRGIRWALVAAYLCLVPWLGAIAAIVWWMLAPIL